MYDMRDIRSSSLGLGISNVNNCRAGAAPRTLFITGTITGYRVENSNSTRQGSTLDGEPGMSVSRYTVSRLFMSSIVVVTPSIIRHLTGTRSSLMPFLWRLQWRMLLSESQSLSSFDPCKRSRGTLSKFLRARKFESKNLIRFQIDFLIFGFAIHGQCVRFSPVPYCSSHR